MFSGLGTRNLFSVRFRWFANPQWVVVNSMEKPLLAYPYLWSRSLTTRLQLRLKITNLMICFRIRLCSSMQTCTYRQMWLSQPDDDEEWCNPILQCKIIFHSWKRAFGGDFHMQMLLLVTSGDSRHTDTHGQRSFENKNIVQGKKHMIHSCVM